MVRQSSKDAYATLNIQAQEKIILRALSKRKNMTRNEIASATGLSINRVTGRVNRLIKLNVLTEGPRRKDRETGYNNHWVSL